MSLNNVHPGDAITAAGQNDLINAVNRGTTVTGHGGGISSGSNGIQVRMPKLFFSRAVVVDRLADSSGLRNDVVLCEQTDGVNKSALSLIVATTRIRDIGDELWVYQPENHSGLTYGASGATVQDVIYKAVGDEPNVGVVVANGPNGEANFTGPQYWVQLQSINAGSSSSAIPTFNVMQEGTPAKSVIVPVTNLAELAETSHCVMLGTQVLFWGVRQGTGSSSSSNTPGNSQWVTNYIDQREFLAQITGSSLISANLWSYTFAQAQPTASAGGWQLVTGGITGTAYNSIEAGNAATGTLSTGWNPANFCSTNITLQPIRTGAVVMIHSVANCATPPANVYVFAAANVIDGAC